MFTLRYKRVGGKYYRTIKSFKEYRRAYGYLGDLLQEKHNLHWSFSVKYLMCGYDKRKIFKLGSKSVRRDNICYIIIDKTKTKKRSHAIK